VIVIRDLMVCIPAKVKLEKYSESILYVLQRHLLQFVILYEVSLRVSLSVSAVCATSGLVACCVAKSKNVFGCSQLQFHETHTSFMDENNS
jgi:hypothetical protein